ARPGDGWRRAERNAGWGGRTGSALERARARAGLGDRGDPQLSVPARRFNLWRHERDHEEHRLEGRAGAVMDFDLTDEQRLLRDSVDRLLADTYAFEKRKGYSAEPEGWSRALWLRYAELGMLGLPFAEEHGGFGGGGIETMLVMQAFGRVLALEPYLASVVLSGTALRFAGNQALEAALLPRMTEGKLVVAFAHGERQARYDLSDVLTSAKRKGGGWVLDGAK